MVGDSQSEVGDIKKITFPLDSGASDHRTGSVNKNFRGEKQNIHNCDEEGHDECHHQHGYRRDHRQCLLLSRRTLQFIVCPKNAAGRDNHHLRRKGR